MLKKKTIPKSDKLSVTFETGPLPGAASVHLAGDFNDWNPASHPMKQRKDGCWSITLRLPREREYQYRFVINSRDWVTDDQTDRTAPNPHGGMNAVVLT
ncbi:MAG: isoamylase early set domain-containing protein [Acidobacteria bacterium]|nr:isoamylase early set domain-containing protein [Acidobacteriota bacterium]